MCLRTIADRVLRLERDAAREQLVEDDADRVEVAARVERLAPALLGRHVLGRADDEARASSSGRADVARLAGAYARELGDLRDAEVAHLHDVARPALVVGAARGP